MSTHRTMLLHDYPINAGDVVDLVNHIVLPPKLPDKSDTNTSHIEQNLLRLTQEVAASMDYAMFPAWTNVSKMLLELDKIKTSGELDHDALDAALAHIQIQDSLAIYLAAQNAGVLIRRKDKTTITFESFELSATSESVMSTCGRQLRTFPGRAVSCSPEIFFNKNFRSELVKALPRLNSEPVSLYQPVSKKAGNVVREERDSTHPGLVNDYLMTMICALGQDESVQASEKCTRDDVCWTDALLPWRRSPFWLFLRVSILRTLVNNQPTRKAQEQYKLFMIRLVARLLQLACHYELQPDMVSVIHAKLARRVCKHETACGQVILPDIKDISNMAQQTLHDVWSRIISDDTTVLQKLPSVDVEEAVNLSLANSRPALLCALESQDVTMQSTSFQPPRYCRIPPEFARLPSLQQRHERPTVLLADVELWIEKNLSSWVEQMIHTPELQVCDDIYTLMEDYWRLAVTHYDYSPLEMSFALLTVAELWVALDKICSNVIPLLERYPPEIPQTLFSPLLLPKLEQMQRLSVVEAYITSRTSNASTKTSCMFSRPNDDSFAVWFYAIAPRLHDLRHTITQSDEQKKVEKINELRSMNDQYHQLLAQHNRMGHKNTRSKKGNDYHNKNKCPKCQLADRIDRMRLVRNEESLPRNVEQAKSAVFELAAPIEFCAWRDATWFIIHDICHRTTTRDFSNEHMYTTVLAYNQLQPFADRRARMPRVTLGSATKTFLQSHYKGLQIPALEAEAYVNNALKYEMWGQDGTGCYLGNERGSLSIKDYCTLKLPVGPYSNLEWALCGTEHTCNQVMARQNECADQLEIREFIAYCSLRSGERIQWLNILREIGSSNLTQNQEAVSVLMLQSVWEAGTASDDAYRAAHLHLQDDLFCTKLLDMLEKRLSAIESNWQEQHSMSTLIQLGLRLLSLSSDPAIHSGCIKLLGTARDVCLGWTCRIRAHAYHCEQEDTQAKAANLLLGAAMLCYSILDVDDQHIAATFASSDDIEAAIEARATICDNTPADKEDLPRLLQQNLLHSHKIAHKLERHLLEVLRDDTRALNKAVSRLWSNADLGATWHLPDHDLGADHHSWIYSQNFSEIDGVLRTVHVNLLDGDLLINGKPIEKIPEDLRRLPMFRQIFGSKTMIVYSSEMSGMDYGVSQKIEGNEVHIGVRNGSLLVRARHGQKTFQALPPSIFAGDVPEYLLSHFTHWLNEVTGEVEFRPRNQQWVSATTNPLLTFSDMNFATATAKLTLNPAKAMNCQTMVVDSVSDIGKAINNILSVLDDSSHVELVKDQAKPGEIQVYLRRYNLRFIAASNGELQSLEYNAVVDTQQDIGTFIGLQDRLVLRDTLPAGGPYERRVIIPYGKPRIDKGGNHINICIEREEIDKQRYFVYEVTRHVCRLKGRQDILGTLNKAHLHALMSFCLPDPLTGRTGTEESLAILQEASLFSSTPLIADEVEVLGCIASLTPQRYYYPEHKCNMERMVWNNTLSFLSQHDDFFSAANTIMDHHTAVQTLHGVSEVVQLRGCGDQFLHQRAESRSATLIRSGLVTSSVDERDTCYESRDKSDANGRASQVYEVASLVRQWPSRLSTHDQLVTLLKGWNFINGYHSGSFSIDSLEDLSQLKFAEHWGALYEYCRKSQRTQMSYSIMFKFCGIALGDNVNLVVRTLLAFAFSDGFSNIDPPAAHRSYQLGTGSSLAANEVLRAVQLHARELQSPLNANATQQARHAQTLADQDTQCQQLSAAICAKWPAETVAIPRTQYAHVNVQDAAHECQSLFNKWQKNRQFLAHISVVSNALSQMQAPPVVYHMPQQSLAVWPGLRISQTYPDMIQLLRKTASEDLSRLQSTAHPLIMSPPTTSEDSVQVERLVKSLTAHTDSTHERYAQNLVHSIQGLQGQAFDLESYPVPIDMDDFERHHRVLSKIVEDLLHAIQAVLSPSTTGESILQDSDLWPRISLQNLVAQLSLRKYVALPKNWQCMLIHLGERVALLQRAERMVKLRDSTNWRSLWKELKHTGREGWSATDYPSWLLLEIENNITIRPLQARVAKEMLAPRSGGNAVLQLNMGEGKSSVIIPMLATVLANGKQLVRVVVLKPLLRQTEQVLTQCCGGLLNHRICHLPFSRKTEVDHPTVEVLSQALRKTAKGRGILISLPEEILSMRLMTREKMTSEPSLASKVLDLNRWLERHSRDLLDESDEILSVRSQLIYPVGGQQMLDGKNERWFIAQALLQRVAIHASEIAAQYPTQMELDYGGKSFPLLKFLSSDVGHDLHRLLVKDAMDGHIAGISFDYYHGKTRDAVESFISQRKSSPLPLERLNGLHRSALLIIRGLLAHDVLDFAIQRKRWLVDYGLAPERCLMAVPYRAKGVPSTNSEFGHPDVAILLTCLSYYYTGLTIKQMYSCFKILLKDANAQDIYYSWAIACQNLPAKLGSFDSINLDDQILCEESLFPHMQYNIGIISFYLNQVVFPKEGKEFETRISGAAWDIPSVMNDPNLVTSGFSGTNDNREILPFSIRQSDLDELRHTNAMVLNILLRAENQTYVPAIAANGGKLGVPELLSLLTKQEPRIDVLIDVGAQILEATNLQLVRAWLDLEVSAPAAVYFDEDDEAMVLDRSGTITPLRVSPFQGKLTNCLIYMDEVHTRGVDLTIPNGARGAVTLGPRLVKDRLMQACMRLRSLGNGHTLCFVSPPEVHRSILAMRGGDSSFSSFDVLTWSMEQTCQSLDIARPLRAMHGLEYLRQQKIVRRYLPAALPANSITSKEKEMTRFWTSIQEDETRKLDLLYGIHDKRVGVIQALLDRSSSDPMMVHLVKEYDIMNKFLLEDSGLMTEQERELAHETERQRQVERPLQAKALEPKISKGLQKYMMSGSARDLARCDAIGELEAFQGTTVDNLDHHIQPRVLEVLVTQDFFKSVHLHTTRDRVDDYLRPVNWVVSSPKTDKLLIISPYEANTLLPLVSKYNMVRLHIFAARISKKMASFGDLQFWTINPMPQNSLPSTSAIRDLNIFTGSLYTESLAKYEKLCDFLGIVTRSTLVNEGNTESDGFVSPKMRAQIGWPEFCPFTHSPLPFLRQVLSLRLNGQEFGHSHLGALLSGRALHEAAFEEADSGGLFVDAMDVD